MRNAAIAFLGAVVSGLLGYVFRLVVARIEVDQYGLYNLGLTALNLLFVIGSAGLLTGVTRFTAAYVGSDRRHDVSRIFSTALVVTLPLSIALSTGLFVLAPGLANRFGNQGLVPIFRLVAFLLPVTMLQELFLSVTDGLKRTSVRVGLTDILQNIVKIGLMLLFFRLASGATAAFVALGLSTVLTCVLAGIAAYRLVPIKPQLAVDRDLLRYSYPLLFAKFISTFYGWTDTLVIGLVMTTRDVGVYNAALPTAVLLLVPSQSILSIYLPTLAELTVRQEDVSALYHRVTRWIFVITLPAALFQMIFSRAIVVGLFGAPYAEAGSALAVLAFGFLIQAISKPSGTLLHAHTRTQPVLAITTASMLLNLMLSVGFILSLGIFGAGLATALTGIATAAAYWTVTRRHAAFRWRDIHPFKPIAAALMVIGAARYVSSLVGDSLPVLIVGSAAVMGTYLWLLVLWNAFDETDRELFDQIIKKLGIGSSRSPEFPRIP